MLNFKEYIAEAKLWSDALNSKPEKYGASFADRVNADDSFSVTKKGNGYDAGDEVKLDKSNSKLLNVLSGALSKEGLIDDLYDADPNEKVLKWKTTKSGKRQSPSWKAKDPKGNSIFVILNDLDKGDVKATDSPTGGEWESLISIGYNMKRLGHSGISGTSTKNKDYGIDKDVYLKLKKYWPKWGSSAIEI